MAVINLPKKYTKENALPSDYDEEGRKEYISKLRKHYKESSTCEYAGELIEIGVCDGFARYIVVSIVPFKVVKLPQPLTDYFYVGTLSKNDVVRAVKIRRLLYPND